MKRKDYQEPTMRVVKLHHTGMLMTSGLQSERNSYGAANSAVSGGEYDSEGNWVWN